MENLTEQQSVPQFPAAAEQQQPPPQIPENTPMDANMVINHSEDDQQQLQTSEFVAPTNVNNENAYVAAMETNQEYIAKEFSEPMAPVLPERDEMANHVVLDVAGLKRKPEYELEDTPDMKRSLSAVAAAEEKKGLAANLRKNIRDVMDEHQLDTHTLAAQREESERLARVVEQQKIIREHQRQAAINRQFVRTQNRVLSLLQSGTTYGKVAEVAEESALDEDVEEEEEEEAGGGCSNASTELMTSNEQTLSEETSADSNKSITKTKLLSTPTIEGAGIKQQAPTADVVTIEDSSSEDDCILLSDDEEDLEEEVDDDPTNSGLHVKDSYNVPDEQGRVVVNIGHPEGEEDIYTAPQIAKIIKPHQIGGVRFLYDNIIESTKRFKSSSGFGCILSHSMGLGKTLQVVCFCDIFLRHTSSKTVLCVMPINTLQNWVSEFNMWIPKTTDDPDRIRTRNFDVYVLNDQQKTLSARSKVILKWAEEGGVLLIGYELFRLLALKLIQKRKRRNNKYGDCENVGTETSRRLMDNIHQALVKPGPDLVICDEGHRIKNAHAGISVALKQIRTRRRIVLTGYPLQNNLLEYWCMVDFVRPNYLGTRTEFCNMFERPIQNGQCIDSTPEDIKLMRYRAHVLHSLLLGFVQRRSHLVLQQTLPQKLEYVVLARMTSFQRQLYDTFMNDIVRSKAVPNPLKAFAVCCKIWNHPDVLYNFLKKRETDLDLEMEEADLVTSEAAAGNAVAKPIAETIDAKSETKTEPIEPVKEAAEPLIIKSEVIAPPLPSGAEFSQDKLMMESSIYNQNKLSGPEYPVKPCTDLELQYANMNRSYENNYFPQSYCPENNDMSYSNNCGNGNYWPEPNVPYLGYQPVSGNMGFSSKPNYVGMMVKDSNEPVANHSESATNSSEIVDLDTKEIKTVETDIDMSRNPVIKNEAFEEKPNTEEKTETTENLEQDKDKEVSADAEKSPTILAIEKESPKVKGDDGVLHEWAIELMRKYQPGLITNSPKMEIFFCILEESVKMGDRVLVFSQSLLTLNLIEQFLQSNYVPGGENYWARGTSYFRLDGSTTSQERERLVNEFNTNSTLKLFLISTRAGSLGINLIGANRVIVFDASWNPCHDTQAVYRIYRYGQQKPCYVYRIVMDKCLEKKIYDRQIKKQGMSDRVVDECNPDAHLSMRDITNLCHDYDDDKIASDSSTFTQPLDSYLDVIVQKVVERHKDCLSKEPFYHESLLIDRKEKKLSQAEKRQAHRGYEMEKKASTRNTVTMTNKIQYRIVRNDGTVVTRPVASIRPMQNTKTTTPTKSGGLRSTRWIPAEVWQRQGMTAQEMTLPLDVVIPTHSNDKSNIILKSGQRVMVLKSAKGIYMQLESGKIIAIRTTTKATEANKTDKDEVIDITAESDGAADTKKVDAKRSTTQTSNESISNTAKEESQSKNSLDFNKQQNTKEFTSPASLKRQKDNPANATTSPNKASPLASIKRFSPIYPQAANAEEKADTKKCIDTFAKKKTSTTHLFDEMAVMPPDASRNRALPNNQNTSHNRQLGQVEPTPERANKPMPLPAQPPAKEVKKPYSEHSIKNSINNQLYTPKPLNINKSDDSFNVGEVQKPKTFSAMPQDNQLSYTSKVLPPAPPPHGQDFSLTQPAASTSYQDATTADLTKYPAPISQKGKAKVTSEYFPTASNSTKLKSDKKSHAKVVAPPPTEGLPPPAPPTTQRYSPQHSHLNLGEPVQYPQYPLFQQDPQQQQRQSKMHAYAPSYEMPHAQYNSSEAMLHPNAQQCLNPNPENNRVNDAYNAASRDVRSSFGAGGGGEANASSSMLTPCEYPPQYVDYPPYGSYNNPHYFPHFHSNAYGNGPTTSISSNAYHHMHWPPLVNPASMHEQCNTMCAPTCSQNGAPSNQWYNKL